LKPFGVGGRPPRPRPLVERTPQICVYDLAGSLFVPLAREEREEEVHVVINGKPEVLDVVREPWGQRFFLCPDCSRKVWHLYLRNERLTCRKCAGLDYASRHVRRRGLNRARRLRQKIGAPAGLLSTIPSRPRHWRRASDCGACWGGDGDRGATS